MTPALPARAHSQSDWVRRFAYRAMLLQPAMDTMSARWIAESQFDAAGDLDPEDAAEIFTPEERPAGA